MTLSLKFWAQAFYCIWNYLKKKEKKKPWKKNTVRCNSKYKKGEKISTNIYFWKHLNAQNINIEIMTKKEDNGKWFGVTAD